MPQADDTKVQDKNLEGKPKSEVHAEPKPTDSSELPEGTSDRTKEQFDKLKESKRIMKAELDALKETKKKESVLDSLKPKAPPVMPTPTVAPTKPVAPALVDQEGYVDANVLQNRLTNAEQRAEQAEQSALTSAQRFERYEETTQTRAAYKEFPQLDPNSDKFDKKFYEQTRKELIVQMVNGEKDLVKAAHSVSEYLTPKAPKESEEDKKKEADAAKTSINAGMNRSAAKKSTYTEMDEDTLVKRTQRGDKLALAERMKRAGY